LDPNDLSNVTGLYKFDGRYYL